MHLFTFFYLIYFIFLYNSKTINTKKDNNIKEIKCIKGTDDVCKNTDKKGTSITIICNNMEQNTPTTINLLEDSGTLKAEFFSLLQLNT